MASNTEPPKKTIYIPSTSVDIVGFDCLWHNMDCRSDFTVFRTWYYCEMDKFFSLVADRVRRGVFSVISLNATKHAVHIVFATQKNTDELIEKWLDREYWPDGNGVNMMGLEGEEETHEEGEGEDDDEDEEEIKPSDNDKAQ
ncbi:hypothetical protein CC79DRAFT_919160 [Sarocladium strictum]